jgi:virulence-associated protein VagC
MPLTKDSPEYPVKLFRHGGSQAARLPKELRIDAAEAIGYRDGDEVILRAAPVLAWPKGYWESFGPVGEDFVAPEPLPPTPHRDTVLEGL